MFWAKVMEGPYTGKVGVATYQYPSKLYKVEIPNRRNPEITEHFSVQQLKLLSQIKKGLKQAGYAHILKQGKYYGRYGDAILLPDKRRYHVAVPNNTNPIATEYFYPHELRIYKSAKRSILEKKEFVKLHDPIEGVQIIGCKGACNSVWCPECYKRKGGSKRFSKRLKKLHYKATRQVVLTVDLKKFENDPQFAFEELKRTKVVPQFIHNLRRTEKVKIVDWAWNLEWHTDGSPHWHLFIQTRKGRKGQIGNERLLAHWKHGMVFESFIRSRKHWERFTDYFGANGYFNPNSNIESKDKSHQLELPEWAKKVTYKIRKTGSMNQKHAPTGFIEDTENGQGSKIEGSVKPKQTIQQPEKTYEEILNSCGQTTYCQIRRGDGNLFWKKIDIPYKLFKEFPGEYLHSVGHLIQMTLDGFWLFLALYDETPEPEPQTATIH